MTDQSNPLARPTQIGHLVLDVPVFQAALSGYSDGPMRLIAREAGAPYTLCEVMLDKFLVQVKKRQVTRRLLGISDAERPVGGQLMGAEPEAFTAGAVRLVEAGFDVIDINFGCPVKKVLGKCRGGFHLSQPDVALEIVRRTRDAVPEEIPVTVKMRRGIDDTPRSRDQFFKILDGAFEIGVAAITVHGRTVEQRYKGRANRQFLAEVKRHAGERVIFASGDLFSPRDCLDVLRETGVDGLAVARGAIGNPWIFAQLKAMSQGQPQPDPPSLHEQRDVIRRHFELAEEIHGERKGCQVMRKFGIKYAALHPQSIDVRNAFVAVRCRADWLAALDRWYAEDLPGQYPDPAIHKVGPNEE